MRNWLDGVQDLRLPGTVEASGDTRHDAVSRENEGDGNQGFRVSVGFSTPDERRKSKRRHNRHRGAK